jgi:hypothetical protein
VTSLSFCGHHFLISGSDDGIAQMYDLIPEKGEPQPRMMRGEPMPGPIRFVLALQQLPLVSYHRHHRHSFILVESAHIWLWLCPFC